MGSIWMMLLCWRGVDLRREVLLVRMRLGWEWPSGYGECRRLLLGAWLHPTSFKLGSSGREGLGGWFGGSP